MNERVWQVMFEQAEGGDALAALAIAVDRLATQVSNLGNGDAATSMGAIEALGVAVKEGNAEVARALGSIAASIDDLSFVEIAEAIGTLAPGGDGP